MLVSFAALAAFTIPPATDKADTARWMVSTLTWGYMSTISTRTNASTPGDAFGNPYSFADVAGVPYFYVSDLDASIVDLFNGPGAKPRASLALSEATLRMKNGSAVVAACEIGTPLGDPENPPCARLVVTGKMVKLTAGSDEEKAAHDALFKRHSSFAHYPKDHAFYCTKLEIDGLWLIDAYGGAAIIKPADYFAAQAGAAALALPMTPTPRAGALAAAAALGSGPPFFWEKAPTARWMAATLDWGVLSTVSTRSEGTAVGDAFGNPYSFADADGVPYFFASMLDGSMIDLFGATNANPRATFALSAASLTGKAVWTQSCKIGTYLGDPENPPCARLVLSGTVVKLADDSTEAKKGKAALLQRHPSFANYPSSHDFFVGKMQLDNIWLIDMFGGAALISPTEYFKAKP